ncbi:hypothetical protein EEL31_08695 [Brevibacillus laterosporus]|nr:hypothetical protein [Brevibacillus laterosporus]TPG68587.1 hypothetical protein EEL31_08695 [Brevibacillus laterosporus]
MFITESITERKLTVVCMQWFDEYDYHEDRFMTDEDGKRLKFHTKERAEEWLNNNVKPDMIDPQYLKFNRSNFLL